MSKFYQWLALDFSDLITYVKNTVNLNFPQVKFQEKI